MLNCTLSVVLHLISSSHPHCWPRKRQKTLKTVRAFSSAAPKLWNSLSIALREYNSKETFKKHLKTYLFLENYFCSSCAPATSHFFFLICVFVFVKAQWACCYSMDASVLYKLSSSWRSKSKYIYIQMVVIPLVPGEFVFPCTYSWESIIINIESIIIYRNCSQY